MLRSYVEKYFHCFFEQKTLCLFLSTGWFPELIQECFYMLTAFYTIKLK